MLVNRAYEVYFKPMNPELIALLTRFVTVHEKLADAQCRIADAMHHTEGRLEGLTFADGLIYQLGRVADAIERVEDKLPEPPEAD